MSRYIVMDVEFAMPVCTRQHTVEVSYWVKHRKITNCSLAVTHNKQQQQIKYAYKYCIGFACTLSKYQR